MRTQRRDQSKFASKILGRSIIFRKIALKTFKNTVGSIALAVWLERDLLVSQ